MLHSIPHGDILIIYTCVSKGQAVSSVLCLHIFHGTLFSSLVGSSLMFLLSPKGLRLQKDRIVCLSSATGNYDLRVYVLHLLMTNYTCKLT